MGCLVRIDLQVQLDPHGKMPKDAMCAIAAERRTIAACSASRGRKAMWELIISGWCTTVCVFVHRKTTKLPHSCVVIAVKTLQ